MKVTLYSYVEKKFGHLSSEHQAILRGVVHMLNGTLKEVDIKHLLFMLGFPKHEVFAKRCRFDKNLNVVTLP